MNSLQADELYAELGEVPWSFPIMQGDVFDSVAVPGLGGTPRLVQVVMHPCVMRRGATLLDRLTVAPVDSYQTISESVWATHLRVMPLPGLREGHDYAAKLVDISAVPIEELTLSRRIAALTQGGVLVLQQRLIMHSTRYSEVDLEVLRKVSASVFAETELQTDWVDAAIERFGQSVETVDAAVAECQSWLGKGAGSPRARLEDESNHSAVRREAREAIRARYAG